MSFSVHPKMKLNPSSPNDVYIVTRKVKHNFGLDFLSFTQTTKSPNERHNPTRNQVNSSLASR